MNEWTIDEMDFTDKTESMKRALSVLSKADTFCLVSMTKEGEPYCVIHCDEGKETEVTLTLLNLLYNTFKELDKHERGK